MELPECKETTSTHLPDAVIQKCLHKPHAPINPHSQRLLTAEARAAAKLPKAKAKATAKATAKAKSGESKAKGKAKKDKTDAEHQAESSVSRTAAIVYTWVASQKKEFHPKCSLSQIATFVHLIFWCQSQSKKIAGPNILN